MTASKVYSIPTLKRLPAYLRELRSMRAHGERHAATPAIAEALHLDSMTVRKDLELIGVAGLTGVGYPVDQLIDGIETFLGWKNTSEVFLVGTGGFGSVLPGYAGFASYGLKIIAGFDSSILNSGETLHGIPLFPLSEFSHLASRLQIKMAILSVSDHEAQETAEHLISCGILAIWNFTEHTLKLPKHIITQKVNLAGDLAVLSVKLAEKLHEGIGS